MKKFLVLRNLSLIVAATVAGSASGATLIGLTSTQQLVQFNHTAPGVILNTSPAISGLPAGDSIADIDVYPVSQQLYGIGAATGNLYRINPLTGVATLDATPQSSVGTPTDIDFNPTADRLRVFSTGDANFRITPSVNTAGPTGANSGLVTADGTLAYAGGTPNPNLVGNAYTNNFDGAATTSLYSLDADTDQLVIHSGAPQFSTLANVGPLGLNIGNNVGFDIAPTGGAFVSNGNNLYTINLGTGALSPLGAIGGPLSVTTIAVPEPTSLGLLTIGALGSRAPATPLGR